MEPAGAAKGVSLVVVVGGKNANGRAKMPSGYRCLFKTSSEGRLFLCHHTLLHRPSCLVEISWV
jgi:hypothetical protein